MIRREFSLDGHCQLYDSKNGIVVITAWEILYCLEFSISGRGGGRGKIRVDSRYVLYNTVKDEKELNIKMFRFAHNKRTWNDSVKAVVKNTSGEIYEIQNEIYNCQLLCNDGQSHFNSYKLPAS